MKIASYRFRFDKQALMLFVALLLPNLIWFIHPPACDILHVKSVTPGADAIAAFLQVQLAALLIFFAREDAPEQLPNVWKVLALVFVGAYWGLWGEYYSGDTKFLLILAMAIVPCLALVAFSIGRKNWWSVVLCAVFLVCHLLFAVKNFYI